MIRHIFLDWNGTHIDDMRAAYEAACHVLQHCRLSPVGCDTFVQHLVEHGGNWMMCFEHLGISLDAQEIRKLYIPAYLKRAETIGPVKGVRETLQTMRGNNIRLHLLTAAHAKLVEPMLRRIDTYHHERHFEVRDKAAHMQRIMSARGIHPNEVAHVGDLPSDVMAGICAGVHSIGLRTDHVPEKAFMRVCGSWYFADSWNNVLKYLATLNGITRR